MIEGRNVVEISLPEAGGSGIDEGARSQISVWASNPSYRTLRDGSLSANIQALRATRPSLSPYGQSAAFPDSAVRIDVAPQFCYKLGSNSSK
jgi:hypothetical protein